MKNIIYISILCTLLSCAREEYLKNYKLPKEISFAGSATGSINASTKTILDTVKISKVKEYAKMIRLQSIDGLKEIRVTMNGVTIQSIAINASTKDYQIKFPVTAAGQNRYKIDLIETTGNIESYDLYLFAFDNWLPEAKLTYNPQESRLVFTDSKDLDERFGGRISEYRVTVNNVLRKQDENPYFLTSQNNGFTKGSSYMIRLEVIDNDGVIGFTENNITIN